MNSMGPKMKLILKNVFLLGSLSITLVLLNACGGMRHYKPPAGYVENVPDPFSTGQIIHLESGNAVSFDQLIEELGAKDLIFIGEVHNNPEHHLIQIQILQALSARYGPVTLAMESFSRAHQSVVDQYVKGLTTEAILLDKLNWRKSWGFFYYYYRPFMLLAREKGLKVLAINADKAIAKKVARSGLKSLDESERSQIAESIDLSNSDHRSYVSEAYSHHAHKNLKNFEYFYQAQCAREDTMAKNIAEFLKNSRTKMVVLTGNAHIINKYGIPDRTVKRVQSNLATILLYPLAGREIIEKRSGDYIWLTTVSPGRFVSFAHGHNPGKSINAAKDPEQK